MHTSEQGSGLIVSAGEALVDLVATGRIDGDLTFRARPGGSPFNVARTVAALDVPSAFLGCLGTDLLGDRVAAVLTSDGVDDRFLIRRPLPTTAAFVDTMTATEPRYLFLGNGAADRSLTAADLPADFDDVACLHVGSIGLVVEPIATAMEALVEREAGRRTISLDPNIRPALIDDKAAYIIRLERLIAQADIVKASDADLAWLYPGSTPDYVRRQWLALGAAVVVTTLGSDGAAVSTASVEIAIGGFEVAVADTVGAGDTFQGAFLAWLSRNGLIGRDALRSGLDPSVLRTAVRFAVTAAALNCRTAGHSPPTLAEVEAAL